MNHLGFLPSRSPSPLNDFSAIDCDSLTLEEISWEDKVENDIYLHAMLDFVNHGKQQRHQASNPVPMLFQRAVTRPTTEKKPGFWDAFFPKEKDCPIPSVIYIEHESTESYKKQKYIERPSQDDQGYGSTEDELSVSAPSSVSLSLRSEPLTVQTQLCEDDVIEILGLNRIGNEYWNGRSSYFTDVTLCVQDTTFVPPLEPRDSRLPHPWDDDENRRQQQLSDKKFCIEYRNFGYI
jgi:hypothetical protein